MTNQDENRCKTCEYYQEHYVVCDTYFHPIGGHCMCDELISQRRRNIYRLQEDCPFWKEKHLVAEERKENIQRVLCHMNEHLRHIERLLEIDAKESKK